jgi:hypothetical protein
MPAPHFRPRFHEQRLRRPPRNKSRGSPGSSREAALARRRQAHRARRSAPSPAVWCRPARRARRQTSVAARWATRRRTTVVVRDDVVDCRSLNMGVAMRSRGRRREGGGENNCSGKRYFCFAEHVHISWLCRSYFEANWRAGLERKPLAVTHRRRLQNLWIIPRERWPTRYSKTVSSRTF